MAWYKRRKITAGSDIKRENMSGITVRLKSTSERDAIRARAWQRGYRFSLIVFLAP